MEEAIAISDKLAPEHLEIQTENAQADAMKCNHYGMVCGSEFDTVSSEFDTADLNESFLKILSNRTLSR